jgi:hypothetical protein
VEIVVGCCACDEGWRASEGLVVCSLGAAEASDWVEAVEAVSVDVDSRDDRVELEDSRSELAQVYVTVLISSSKGDLKDTCFCAGNMGREEAILRGTMRLLVRMELRLWGCL